MTDIEFIFLNDTNGIDNFITVYFIQNHPVRVLGIAAEYWLWLFTSCLHRNRIKTVYLHAAFSTNSHTHEDEDVFTYRFLKSIQRNGHGSGSEHEDTNPR